MSPIAVPQASRMSFAVGLIGAATFAALLAPVREFAANLALPSIVCAADASAAATWRPRTTVTTLRSEPLVAAPGKRVTTQLVHFPPRAFTPSHVHGGDVTAYVLSGTVRSEHAGLPAMEYHAGEMFHEPLGTTHVFIENPSASEPADVLAVMIHDEGAQLTTFIDK